MDDNLPWIKWSKQTYSQRELARGAVCLPFLAKILHSETCELSTNQILYVPQIVKHDVGLGRCDLGMRYSVPFSEVVDVVKKPEVYQNDLMDEDIYGRFHSILKLPQYKLPMTVSVKLSADRLHAVAEDGNDSVNITITESKKEHFIRGNYIKHGMIDRQAFGIRESKNARFRIGIGSLKEDDCPEQWAQMMEMLKNVTATIDYRKVFPKGADLYVFQPVLSEKHVALPHLSDEDDDDDSDDDAYIKIKFATDETADEAENNCVILPPVVPSSSALHDFLASSTSFQSEYDDKVMSYSDDEDDESDEYYDDILGGFLDYLSVGKFYENAPKLMSIEDYVKPNREVDDDDGGEYDDDYVNIRAEPNQYTHLPKKRDSASSAGFERPVYRYLNYQLQPSAPPVKVTRPERSKYARQGNDSDDVSCMTVEEVAELLNTLGMGTYRTGFVEKNVDGDYLKSLSRDGQPAEFISELKMSTVHSWKLLDYIKKHSV